MTNYKHAVSLKSYKLGSFTGEIHLAKNCTSNDIALTEALKNLENILVKKLYLRKIVQQNINQIKSCNFGPSSEKEKRQAELNNPNSKYVIISLPYTSFRCSVIASKRHKIIKKYTPNFKLNIAFRTIKLKSIILPNLRPQKEQLLASVYKFQCDCISNYIGHSKKLLESRILQHRTYTTSHVYKHILSSHLQSKTL